MVFAILSRTLHMYPRKVCNASKAAVGRVTPRTLLKWISEPISMRMLTNAHITNFPPVASTSINTRTDMSAIVRHTFASIGAILERLIFKKLKKQNNKLNRQHNLSVPQSFTCMQPSHYLHTMHPALWYLLPTYHKHKPCQSRDIIITIL